MSDYTPTTEEEDTRYKLLRALDNYTVGKWQEGIDVGRKQERERIIKLLESHTFSDCNGDTDDSGYCLACTINLHDAIDIVKGEQE